MTVFDDPDEMRALIVSAQALVSPPEKLARTEVPPGFVVSTVITADEGCETAIIDRGWPIESVTLLGACGTFPVERYPTRDEAAAGHAKWVKFLEDGGREITMLGYGEHPPVPIKLVGPS